MEGGSDFIADGDASLFDDRDGGEFPIGETWKEFCEQSGNVAFNSEGGKAIGDDQGQIEGSGIELGQHLPAVVIQFAAQIGTLEIGGAIGNGRVEAQDVDGVRLA